jgi:hypothetical protein
MFSRLSLHLIKCGVSSRLLLYSPGVKDMYSLDCPNILEGAEVSLTIPVFSKVQAVPRQCLHP